jgi:hypothetical protein
MACEVSVHASGWPVSQDSIRADDAGLVDLIVDNYEKLRGVKLVPAHTCQKVITQETSNAPQNLPNTSIRVGMGTEERRSDGDADDPGECEDLECKLLNLAQSAFNEGSKSSRDQHCTSKVMRRGKLHETSHISRGDIVYNVNSKCD